MNTQQRAVVQQALEALEKLYLTEDDEWARDYIHTQATALRQLLEQPKQVVSDEPVGYMDKTKFKMLSEGKSVTTTVTSHRPFQDDAPLYTRPQPAQAKGPYSAPIKHLWGAAPKPWVGFTHEEFIDLCEDASNFGTGSLIRYIEAKLREKNGGA